MNARVLHLDHRWLDSEHVVNPFSREYFSGSAVRDNAPAIQHHDLIGKSRREIEIVDYAYGNNVSGIGEISYPLHEIDLVTDVEKRQRLIQEKIATRISRIVAP